jgi:WD40 repeat protein
LIFYFILHLYAFFLAGEYIATGSLGGNVSVWSLSKGVPLREIQGNGDTFDVSWSADGSLLCSCFSSGMLCVMDTTGSAYLEETAVTATAAAAAAAGGGDRGLSATAAGAGAVLKVEGRSASSPAAPAAAAGEGAGDASAAATATEASAAGPENSVEMSVDDAPSAAEDTTAADTAAAALSAAEAESKYAMDSEEVVMTAVSAADAPMVSAEDEVDADI